MQLSPNGMAEEEERQLNPRREEKFYWKMETQSLSIVKILLSLCRDGEEEEEGEM